jgi:hypothetical protein
MKKVMVILFLLVATLAGAHDLTGTWLPQSFDGSHPIAFMPDGHIFMYDNVSPDDRMALSKQSKWTCTEDWFTLTFTSGAAFMATVVWISDDLITLVTPMGQMSMKRDLTRYQGK